MDSSDSSKNSTSSNQTIEDNNSFINASSISFTDSLLPNTIVQTLLSYRQQGVNNSIEIESFSRRAIESLIKKLKDRRDFLDNLILSVTTKGLQETGCVTIARTLDGRLQVAGKKGFPHVIFAKIWRWPELSKNELRHLHICQYPFDLKLDHVCVNPYHYERIAPATESYISYFQNNNVSSNSCSVLGSKNDILAFSHTLPQSNYSLSMTPQQQSIERTHCQTMNYSVLNISTMPNCTTDTYITSNHHSPEICIPLHSDKKNSWTPSAITPIETIPIKPVHPVQTSQFTGNSIEIPHRAPSTWNNTLSSPSSQNLYSPPIGVINNNNFGIQNINLSAIPIPNVTPTVCETWCTIMYYEYEDHIGEVFKVPSSVKVVNIDGYVDTNNHGGSRFSLGQFSNINRDDICSRSLMHIGKGISLEQERDNDFHITCNGKNSVYMESYYLDDRINKPHGCVVHKIYPRAKLKCFDLNNCYNEMNNIIQSWSSGTYVSSPYNDEFRSQTTLLSILTKHCSIRLSFVKGWGPDYPRQFIHHTPCWIEIIFTKAMAKMDELLRKYHVAVNTASNIAPPIFSQIGTSLNNVS